MDNLGYLFAAYSLIFLAIGLYVLFVGQRQKRLEGQLSELEASLQDVEKRVPLHPAAEIESPRDAPIAPGQPQRS